MFILLIDVDDDTRSVVFNDLSLHDKLPKFTMVLMALAMFCCSLVGLKSTLCLAISKVDEDNSLD